eukprot:CAMPEP_0119012986 /NCGR_PEP_ID=MMETSP1176-20130426/7733_1 /TAXON_ID=265551 /ORGANISM="Synedropsis recta cf, Strain CCMP1620" /LENGTH=267 /DNA_ID=CAMNT_0006966029 /DNA_START=25 /DNA_END=828 /DNA_ORIENTATION=+
MTLLTILARTGVPASRAQLLRPTVATPLVSQMIASKQQQSQQQQQQQQSSALFNNNTNFQSIQIRSITKRKKRLLVKKAGKAALAEKGIFPPKPPKYMDKQSPVVNALSREDRNAEAKRADQVASLELKERMAVAAANKSNKETDDNDEPSIILRYHMEGLQMSDRVRKLFDLTNGNQSEVVKAQKQRGMELFQRREGDTGSSAVQVIALTTKIQQMQTHMRTHKKDKSSKRGLDAMFVRRRKLLDYMERKEFDSYRRVVKTLGLVR